MPRIWIVLAFCFVACGGSSPTAPNGCAALSRPPADPAQYWTPPLTRRLVDSSGNDTRMWVTVRSIRPPAGSAIVTDPNRIQCPSGGNCFNVNLELGLDSFHPNQFISADFVVGFSADGLTMSAPGSAGSATIGNWGGVFQGTTGTCCSTVRGLDFLPKYLLITGRHPDVLPGPNVVFRDGQASILLDYQPCT